MRQRNAEPSGQCRAVLKWIYNTRCSRRASLDGDLCIQHARHGATIPGRWATPQRNAHGVLISRPEPPYRRIEARRAPPASPAVTHTGQPSA